MARPQKVGLDYFPLDVDIDQDDKVALIEAQHGMLGFGIIIKLLMKVYSEGYFYNWTEKEQILFSRRVNVDINTINAIIEDCSKWGIFSSELLKKYEILTSKGIQVRYFEATKRRQRVEVIKEYLLLGKSCLKDFDKVVIVDINRVNVNINPQTDEVTETSIPKEKNRKEKNRKEDIYILSDDENKFINTLTEIDNYPLDRKKDLEMYKTLEERYTELDLLEAIESWKLYKLDQPLKKNSNARSQINTSFKNYVEWNKCLKGTNGTNNSNDPYAGMEIY